MRPRTRLPATRLEERAILIVLAGAHGWGMSLTAAQIFRILPPDLSRGRPAKPTSLRRALATLTRLEVVDVDSGGEYRLSDRALAVLARRASR